MIEKTVGWKVGEEVYSTIELAQEAEVRALMIDKIGWKRGEDHLNDAVQCVVRNKDAIVNILTTTEKSRPSARKQNGAVRKTRKQIRKSLVTQFNADAAQSADEMRERIAKTGGVV